MATGTARPHRPLRVGNGAGFWGDNLDAPYLLARDGRLDVLTLEYLAELTMAILSHLRAKDPDAGYVTDFPDLLDRLGPILREQDALRIVTNAGGLNPPALRRAMRGAAGDGGAGGAPAGRGDRRRPARSHPATGSATGSTSRTWRRASRSRPSPTAWSAPTPTSAPGRSPRRWRRGLASC